MTKPKRARLRLFLSITALAALSLPAAIGVPGVGGQLTLTAKQNLEREARLVVDMLQNHHFSGLAFREMPSSAMIARSIRELDPQAEFLTAEDVAFLHRRFGRTLKPVYLFRGDLQPAFEIFDRFITRFRERVNWIRRRLDREFDFSSALTVTTRTDPQPFATREEADRHWELLVAEQVLVEELRGRSPAEARAAVRRFFDQAEATVLTYDALSVRERFFDGLIRSFDPHSGYFSADSAREFAVEMERAVVGIGLEVRKEDGRCVVASVQAGGPAELSGELQPHAVIHAIAEGAGPWQELAPLRLREIVAFLRGPAGTQVRLDWEPAGGGARRETELTRTRVAMTHNRARGAVCLVPASGGVRRIGWIHVPGFYAAGEQSELSSVSRDVRELLAGMASATLDGLVMDLRGNSGGALPEAAALSELFLPGGRLMLSRGLDGTVTPHVLKEGEPVYTGPLVVLVSPDSASASEVFAGAMRHHQRAVIAGAPATYGKGTVQNYVDLTKLPGGDPAWGTLRLTRERYYLPDGGSVQWSGVPADIVFPETAFDDSTTREKDLPGAFSADTLTAPPADPPPAWSGRRVTPGLVGRLRAATAEAVAQLPEWQLLARAARARKELWSENDRPLQREARQSLWDRQVQATHEWRRERRHLADTLAYPAEIHELQETRESLGAQDVQLRQAGAVLHRLHQGALVIETRQGRWRKLRLDEIDYAGFVPDTPELAAQLADEFGRPVTADQLKDFFRSAALLDHPGEPALLSLASALTNEPAGAPATRAALATLLTGLTRLEPSLKGEHARLDVPLREALRLAARWAEDSEPTSTP